MKYLVITSDTVTISALEFTLQELGTISVLKTFLGGISYYKGTSVCFISLLWLATLFMWTKQAARSIDHTSTALLLFQQHYLCFSNQQFKSCCITSLVLLWSASLACINPKLFPTVNTQECTAPIGYYWWCECKQKSPWSLGSSWYCSLLLLLVLKKR